MEKEEIFNISSACINLNFEILLSLRISKNKNLEEIKNIDSEVSSIFEKLAKNKFKDLEEVQKLKLKQQL